MADAIKYTLKEAVERQEEIKPGFAALFGQEIARFDADDHWAVYDRCKILYEQGARA